MRPDLSRLLIGPAGLLIGFLLYGWAIKQPQPAQHWAIGGMFVLLGAAAAWYGRSITERWVIVLGAVLMVYGLLRAFLIR